MWPSEEVVIQPWTSVGGERVAGTLYDGEYWLQGDEFCRALDNTAS